jgi:hypothetical protein
MDGWIIGNFRPLLVEVWVASEDILIVSILY